MIRETKPKSTLNPLALADDEVAKEHRRRLRANVPSFDYVVRKVAELSQPLLVVDDGEPSGA